MAQASADGARVATFDQHRVLVWPSNAWQPRALDLHISKTVSVIARPCVCCWRMAGAKAELTIQDARSLLQ